MKPRRVRHVSERQEDSFELPLSGRFNLYATRRTSLSSGCMLPLILPLRVSSMGRSSQLRFSYVQQENEPLRATDGLSHLGQCQALAHHCHRYGIKDFVLDVGQL